MQDIRRQSDEILDLVEFVRDNAGLAPFAGPRATPQELFTLWRASLGKFKDFAEWHIPIYVGRCLIDELEGCWSIEQNRRHAMFGKPFIDGFGNIEYEKVYLPSLALSTVSDVKRIESVLSSRRGAMSDKTQLN